jgi:hypothetical protein
MGDMGILQEKHMKRSVLVLLIMLAIATGVALLAYAADSGAAPPPKQPMEEPPNKRPAANPPAATPPVATPEEIARVLDPSLLRTLRETAGPLPRGNSGVTGPDKLSVLSVPAGCEVYVAAVAEIRQAKTANGGEAAVEDVVFTPEHFYGETPVTLTMLSGDYVLAVRSYGKINGFDGGCVRKTTTDVITGGVRHSYHLYPIRKREGEYQLFVANFSNSGLDKDAALKLPKAQKTFAFDPSVIALDLAAATNVPEEERPALAAKLNDLGIAFYEANGAQYLVKLTLLGAKYKIDEWLVE